MKEKTWVGVPPADCDLCDSKVVDAFIDGRTQMGPWANMCVPCHKRYGVGLGMGKGQKYEHKQDKWIKTEG